MIIGTASKWQPLALCAALCMTAGAHVANAQTVWLKNAAPGSNAELVLNAEKVASGTASASGLVPLAVPAAQARKDTASMHLFVDECGALRRVILADVGFEPASTEGVCQRTAIPEIFEVRTITTFVVDASGSHAVLVRQGSAYDEWLHPVYDEEGQIKSVHEPLPRGLILSGGVSGAKFGDVVSSACGTTSSCSGDGLRIALTGGATYWITRFLGVEGTVMRPQNLHTSGSDTNLTFNSTFESRLLTVAGKIGIPAGPTRIYAIAGADYAATTASTKQTITTSSTAQGGTETFVLETRGWGLLWGGGIEGWLGNRLAIYGEGGRAAVKGTPINNEQGDLNDHLTFITLGLRLRIGL